MKNLVIFGAGDQGRLNWEIAGLTGFSVICFIDEFQSKSPFDVPIYKSIEEFMDRHKKQNTYFSVAIGNPHGKERMAKQHAFLKQGLKPANLIHPVAYISALAHLGEGIQIMAGAVVGPYARIGDAVIINANTSVDHDCVLGDGSEIAPGVTLAGRVSVGKYSWICTGASIGPRVNIGENATIGAGSVVLKDIPDDAKAWGVPAKIIKTDASGTL